MEELNVTFDDLQIAIVTETLPYALMQRKGVPWGKTWKEFVAYVQSHPGEVRYVAGLGSAPDLAMEMIRRHLELLFVISKTSSTSSLVATFGS